MVTKVREVPLDGMSTYVTVFTLVANEIINFLSTIAALITIVIDVLCLPYSRESVRSLTLRLLMSYIYIYIWSTYS